MPRGSSVGWFGCRRMDSVPGSPMVLRKRVTTRHFCATATISAMRMILDTAATISGISPGARRASVALSAASPSSQSRKPPTVRCATGAKAAALCLSMIRRVTSSTS